MQQPLIRLLKKNFLSGLLIVAPLFVIGWMLGAVLGTLWRLPYLLPEAWQPELLFQGNRGILFQLVFTLAMSVLLTFAVAFVGWISKQYLGHKVLDLLSEVILKIPVIRSVYSALDQLLRAFGDGEGRKFNRVVYVEYPRKGSWAIAFVTGPAKGAGLPDKHLNLYIPTTPNPTSGFHLIVPETDVRDSGLSVEEAFKTILSLGIVQK